MGIFGWDSDDDVVPRDNANTTPPRPRRSGVTPLTNDNIRLAVNAWNINANACIHEYGHISNWDTSNITDMSLLFSGAYIFNHNINTKQVEDEDGNMYTAWDVSRVTDMGHMFEGAKAFNQPIGKWDVSKVRNMDGMFFDADAFNQPIGDWDVSNVTNMGRMFNTAQAFNQPISNWDVSSVTNMHKMFHYAENFNQDISNWDISNVEGMNEENHIYDEYDTDDTNDTYYESDDMNDMFKYSGYTYKKPTISPPPPPPVMSEEEFEKCEKTYCEETKTWNVLCGIGHDILLREQAVKPPPEKSSVAYDSTRLQKWLKTKKINPATNTSIDNKWIKQNYPSGLNANYKVEPV